MIEQKYIQTAIDYMKNVAGKFVLWRSRRW